MSSFGEYRRLAREGTLTRMDVPVLLVGFGREKASLRQFRTQTGVAGMVSMPPLAEALDDEATSVMPIQKGARNPYGDFVFVGRGSSSDIVLGDPSVSKSHAAFQREGARWFLKDNRARNGTFVDGRRLEPGERVALTSGVVIGFGACGSYFLEPDHFARLLVA